MDIVPNEALSLSLSLSLSLARARARIIVPNTARARSLMQIATNIISHS